MVSSARLHGVVGGVAAGVLALVALAACGGSAGPAGAPHGSAGAEPLSPEISDAPSVDKIPEANETIVERVRPQIMECYSDALRGDPKAAGKGLYLVQVGAGGKVNKAGLHGLRGQWSHALVDCVAAALRSAAFDLPRGEFEWVAVPIALAPEDVKAKSPR